MPKSVSPTTIVRCCFVEHALCVSGKELVCWWRGGDTNEVSWRDGGVEEWRRGRVIDAFFGS